jgi:hypothetical protein
VVSLRSGNTIGSSNSRDQHNHETPLAQSMAGRAIQLRDLKYKLVSWGPRKTRFRSIKRLSAICCKLCLMLAGDHMFSCFQSHNPDTAFSSPTGTSLSRSLDIAMGINLDQ